MDLIELQAFHEQVKTAFIARAATAIGSKLIGGATKALGTGAAGGMRQNALGKLQGLSDRVGAETLGRRVGYGAMGAGALGAGRLVLGGRRQQ